MKNNASGICTTEDLVTLARMPSSEQRIYITTHPFEKIVDVDKWANEYTDKNGNLIKFAPVRIQPLIFIYGSIYIEKDFCGSGTDQIGMPKHVLALTIMFVIAYLFLTQL